MADSTLSGGVVYVITNNIDDRVYVGATTNAKNRWKTHKNFLRTGRHSHLFQSFWDEHEGRIELTFTVLERVADLDLLHEREQHWIDQLGSADPEKGFNTHLRADSAEGVKRRPETGELISLALTGRERTDEFRERMRQRMLGSKMSEETIEKKRQAMLGMPFHDKRLITYEIACEIRRLRQTTGLSQTKLADRFGITRGMVRDILDGRTYVNP